VKDRLLYLIIGLLVGVVVMQWTMPAGQATVAIDPVGPVIAVTPGGVVTWNGELWGYTSGSWFKRGDLPFPASQLRFIVDNLPNEILIDTNGDYWTGIPSTGTWTNHGQPPVAPVPTSQQSWGMLKGHYQAKGDKK
jgi:hypothetical protein